MFTFTMVFSGGLIPTYLLHMKLGTLNTRWMMILPTVIGVWNLMLARNYFQNSVSPELLEAAQIDGILRLAFSAVDHFVSRCVGEHLLHQKAAKGAVDLPEGQRGGLPAGIGQPA